MDQNEISCLMMLYKENETYHDAKENRAWIASGLYYTISSTFIFQMLRDKCLLSTKLYLWLASIIIIGFYILQHCYVLFQFNKKYISVLYHKLLLERIDALVNTDFTCIENCFHKKGPFENKDVFVMDPEIPVLALSYIFMGIQICILFLTGEETFGYRSIICIIILIVFLAITARNSCKIYISHAARPRIPFKCIAHRNKSII